MKTIKALEDENILLKKKIENLHIALNKKVEKNKNQKEEISLLLKQKEELKELWNIEAIRANKTLILLKEEREKSKINNLDMQNYLLEIMELKEENKRLLKHEKNLIDEMWNNKCKESDKSNEIIRLNTIIKYLQDRLDEK